MSKRTATELDLGCDQQFEFDITNNDEDTAINISGWALSWVLKRNAEDLDAAALLTKTTGGSGIVIAGTFNSDPDQNAQRATVTVLDTNTDSLTEGMAFYELKRTDDGFETRLAYGPIDLIRTLHRT